MNIVLLVFWCYLFGVSFYRNKDLFSPSKIYLVIIFTFFGEIFWDKAYDLSVQLSVLVLLGLNIFVILKERALSVMSYRIALSDKVWNKIVRRIWILSLIPIFAQLYMIQKMGGLSGFVSSIGGRVVVWEGLGVVILLTKLINVLNYLYFIFLVCKKNKRKINILSYAIHLTVFIAIALLSGSRSNLLWNFVFMIIFYNYAVSRISIKMASIGFSAILLVAMVLAIARNGYRIEDGVLATGLHKQEHSLNLSNFHYGLEPIEKVIQKEYISNPHFGRTYVTAVTNLIPRTIWPSKPSSGGVIITREYFGDPYGGYSNYTTGLLPEGIINFGYFAGVVFSVLMMIVFLYVLFSYQKKLRHMNGVIPVRIYIMYAGIYPFLLIGIISYLYTEFTTNTISMMVFKVLLFFLILKVIFASKKMNSLMAARIN